MAVSWQCMLNSSQNISVILCSKISSSSLNPSMYLLTSCQLQASVERWCNIILMSSVVFGSLVITGCFQHEEESVASAQQRFWTWKHETPKRKYSRTHRKQTKKLGSRQLRAYVTSTSTHHGPRSNEDPETHSTLVASVIGYASQKCRGPLRRFSLQGKVSTPPAAYAIQFPSLAREETVRNQR